MENQIPNQNQQPIQNQYQNQYANQQQNPNYATNYVSNNNSKTVSVGDWIITFIIMAIPFVNIIMLLVWAFGNNTPKSKANWAKAGLIFYLIAIILAIIFYGSIIALIASAAAFGR